MKTLTIIQSNYIPWKGYFDLIGLADEFVILDTVQFTKNDWRNRNLIKTSAGSSWLTIPVKTSGKFGQTILETEISDATWAERHWAKIQTVYGRTPGFLAYGASIKSIYETAEKETNLSAINRMFIERLCADLRIATRIRSSEEFPPCPDKNERLIRFCETVGADRYLSGPAAKSYLEESLFEAAGIEVSFIDYGGYREYPQIHPPFKHGVSILDLMFSVGESAREFMKCSQGPKRVL
jgi:hypothetical protein